MKNKISAEVVEYSVNPHTGVKICTLNVTYGRLVHAEFLRHRTISRSVKSSRAIPLKTLRAEVLSNPYIPIKFGKNKAGMVAGDETNNKWARRAWVLGSKLACLVHWIMDKQGIHKEVVNRVIEPYVYVTETITATEWDNFFKLRLADDAQKDIKAIALEIKHAIARSQPITRKYHFPYVTSDEIIKYTAKECFIMSSARCARSSYNNHDCTDCTFEKDLSLYNRLVEQGHGTPLEHPCKIFLGTNYNLVNWKSHRAHLNN